MRYNRISIVLDEFGIDQKDLATLLNVTNDTVSRWCRNENQPRIPDLFNIARMFRIDAGSLLVTNAWKDEVGLSPVDLLKKQKAEAKEKNTTKKKRTGRSSKKG